MLQKPFSTTLLCLLAISLRAQPTEMTVAAGTPPVVALLAGLEYGKPVLGIRAPLDGGGGSSSSSTQGVVTIQRARIEPSGPGIWKNALHPQLVLEDVHMQGSARAISRTLRQMQGGWPGGVKIHKLEISWQTPATNFLHADVARLQEKEIFLEKGWVKLGVERRELKHLDLKIFQSDEKFRSR